MCDELFLQSHTIIIAGWPALFRIILIHFIFHFANTFISQLLDMLPRIVLLQSYYLPWLLFEVMFFDGQLGRFSRGKRGLK